MTTSCIRISSDILIGKNEDKTFDFLSKNLHQIGVTLESTSVILNLRDSIRRSIMSTSSDCIIIIGENDIESHFAIKNAVCDCFGLTLAKNENLIRFLDNYSKSHTIPTNIKNEYFLPEGASILPNAFDYRQGWFLEDDKIIIYLPEDMDNIEYIFNNSLIPFFAKVNNCLYDHTKILLFGTTENDVKEVIADLFNDEIHFTFYEEDMLLTILLRYQSDINKTLLNDCIASIYQRLRKFIITNEDTSIYQLALDLLTLSNKSLCLYETITAGNIALNLSTCNSVAKHLIESCRVGFTQNNIVRELNISQSVISKYGFNSVNTAYEIAGALLDNTQCDLVLLTLGNINEDKICYIAVGDNDGIHIYKSNINDKNKAINVLSNSAIYYLIKKLKQNDLYFNKIIV